ncbi:hypothetical protein [Actinomadura flavalba]|uniref:hypothetical protein n=1 Tax=Actinomadura flavalba TaxID=1120938 RepID=UPI00036437C2|nr:hypothetical protein [Actinomadura flavalba]
MTMLGRGKGRKDGKAADADETAAEEPADEAAPQDAKAAKAAERAREAARIAALAEEAAERAREAARLAQVAAAAAAAADEAAEAGDDDEPVASAAAAKPAAVEVDEPETAESDDDPVVTAKSGTEAKPEADKEDDTDEKDDTPVVLTKSDDEAAEDATSDEKDEPKKTGAAKVRKRERAEAGSGRRRPSAGLTVVLLGVLAVALVVTSGVLFWKKREADAIATASRQAAFAATRAAQDVSSYDFQTLDEDFKTGSAAVTGRLRTQYEQQAQQIRASVTEQQMVATTTVVKTGVISAGTDKVDVLVFANRNAVSKNDKQQRLPEPLRIRLTMEKKGDRWLASNLIVL